ncbi:hypothetical protein DE4585_04927 [Mycobacteroides salmoniphilum]|uniref:Uncharacterized protein n=2 Tax=Mycobacteroides salmoniphilum TaxID=404941 RepID=A0A4R8RZV7_9MYCO|nr:hypothetical protein DE4585_04927 [Mycobacteroides salmoniphilum]
MAVGALRSVNGCPARIEGPDSSITATIYLIVGPPALPPHEPWVKHDVIDGTAVTIADTFASPKSPPRDQVVSATCVVSDRYPGSVVLSATVSYPPAADGCQIGTDLMRVAIGQFAKRPPHGTSTALRTVLTGIDPCRPVTRLASSHVVVWNVADSDTRNCAFTVDGSPEILVSLEYLDPSAEQYQPEHFEIAGHQVAGDSHDGIFNIVVGQEFPYDSGTRIPAVEIADLSKNMDRIKLIATAIAEDF